MYSVPMRALLWATLLSCTACGSDADGTSGTGGAAGTSGTGGGSGSGGAGASGSGGAGGTAGTSGGGGTGGGCAAHQGPESPLGGARPVTPFVPTSYCAGTPVPLVILLHGYSVNGAVQELYFQLQPFAEEYGFIYLHPDGTVENSTDANRFWNATDVCCNFYGSDVDDVAYLSGLISEAKQRYTIDPKRVYFVGHSNGGFMSYRMACELADQIAAIAPLAGSMWGDAAQCDPSAPVSVLDLQGTADTSVPFEGESGAPGQVERLARWRALDGCADTPGAVESKDYDRGVPGDETEVSSWSSGCAAGTEVVGWKMNGSTHTPSLSPEARRTMIEFLLAHPKP